MLPAANGERARNECSPAKPIDRTVRIPNRPKRQRCQTDIPLRVVATNPRDHLLLLLLLLLLVLVLIAANDIQCLPIRTSRANIARRGVPCRKHEFYAMRNPYVSSLLPSPCAFKLAVNPGFESCGLYRLSCGLSSLFVSNEMQRTGNEGWR